MFDLYQMAHHIWAIYNMAYNIAYNMALEAMTF